MDAAPDPEELLRSTDEKENFQLVTRLLISGGSTLLWELFDRRHSLRTLSKVLKSRTTREKLKLTKPQWDILNPSPGVYGKTKDFDITLLFKLLTTICYGIKPPATGWNALPHSRDHSLGADLARLKYYRNTVYGHTKDMEITKNKFVLLWHEIGAALVRIAGRISPAKKNKWQKEINRFSEKRPTSEDERNVQELMEWYRNDMDLKVSMEKVQEGIKQMGKKMEELTTTVNRRMDSLESFVQGGSKEPSAPLGVNVDCVDITAKPDPRGESSEVEMVDPPPTREDVLNLAAYKYLLNTTDHSKPEYINGFKNFIENVKKALIVDTQPGSLIITVKCGSLQILQELWEDYCIGYVNEMAQKFLVTEEVLDELNLAEAKLTTTITEEEYRACQVTLLLFSELERLKRQVDEFHSQFLHWTQTRKRTRALLAEFVRKLDGPPLSGTTFAALVAGASAIPFTFGTSMAVSAAAAFGAGAAGAVMDTWKTQNKTTEVIVEDRKTCQELQEKLGSLEQCISDLVVFCHEHIDLVLSSEVVQDEFGFLVDILQRTEFQAEELAPTLPTLLQDEVTIYFMRVSTFMQQLQRSTATRREVSTIIQHILAELRECPNEEEMQKMIENFIEEIFDTKLSRLGFLR